MPEAQHEVQLEAHRVALTGHCYRMLGSLTDADDAVQDTMVRAWKSLDRFDGRSSLRTWLYRIATNVCLDALESRTRQRERLRPSALGPAGTVEDALEAQPRERWIEPISEQHALPADVDPAERAVLRQSIRLAFVAALQHLPPRQRAALLLTEVLGWSAAEVASGLDTTTAAVNSALQRARSALQGAQLGDAIHDVSPPADLLERYVQAFERYDIDALTTVLREDAQMSMPPFTLWLQGHDAIRGWLLGRGAVCRGSRLLPVAASGAPAFAQYKPAPGGGYAPWSLIVLAMERDRISEMTFFLDVETLFPRFGLAMQLSG